ncbi:MAG TPA: phosphotransferase family protein [Acidimicrobiia bacterium]|nr:phosphotransferase family protein [Acidimicrobiia bacterium]
MAAPDAQRLATALGPVLGAGLTIEGLTRVSGGASRETWLFDAVAGDGTRHGLVLRRDPGGHGGQSDRATEYALLEATANAGVAVPRPRLLLTTADGLGTGFVMERIEGETIPRRILRDAEYEAARPQLARQCGAIAAAIHATDTASLPHLPTLDAAAQIAQWRGVLDLVGEPRPALELGLRWLDERVPPAPTPARLVHGDFRNGNLVVGPDGVRAALDWELAHLGDPVEDLGWLCVRSWRFGVDERVVGGFGDLDELLAGYTSAGGVAPTPELVHYWMVFGTVKWGVITILQAHAHLSGTVRSVELATLGRRVVEMEWDTLDAIEGRW